MFIWMTFLIQKKNLLKGLGSIIYLFILLWKFIPGWYFVGSGYVHPGAHILCNELTINNNFYEISRCIKRFSSIVVEKTSHTGSSLTLYT